MPPPNRPATTGYERLAQADQFSDDSDPDDAAAALGASFASLQAPTAPRYAPVAAPRPHSGMHTPSRAGAQQQGRNPRPPVGGGPRRTARPRSNSGVDLKAINARLERWADEIAAKFKKRGGRRPSDGGDDEDQPLEIHHSVFQAPEGVRPATAESLAAAPLPEGAMRRDEFEAVVESVRIAIGQGTHPRMISQGSSGSYFARNPEGKVVGVFKPKDEEPYAAGNPKWNKWIHRNLFPCCFGRACLIPNLSYVSEAAAYVLDAQLRTNLVPYTDVVYLSSRSFHYPFWDRYAHSRNRKPLPDKPGSFQVFLKGFKDANIFLREHPWPDQYLSGFRTSDTHRQHRKKRWADNCRPGSRPAGAGGGGSDADSDDEGLGGGGNSALPLGPDNFMWTETLKQSFREELEKLVILDYIMRNTDRGLDNWMIKVDWQTQEVAIHSEPMHLNIETQEREQGPRPVDLSQRGPAETRASYPYRAQKPMEASTPSASGVAHPKITVGAIDNSLSWPWKHPDAWRSFPFGWLFLPVDLIGRPFSQRTRDHFLPLLTSTAWWSRTQLALRRVFQADPDFQERMFAKQIAVMKGQAWNVVETLKTPDHGPLELTRRAKVCVWDDLVDVPVAFPMRATSAEMRRRAQHEMGKGIDEEEGGGGGGGVAEEEEEEMDIGAGADITAGAASAPAMADLLGLSSPPADLPHPGRFEIATSPTAARSPDPDQNGTPSPSDHRGGRANGNSKALSPERPRLPRTSIGIANSYSGTTQRSLNMYTPRRERRYSFATGGGGGSGRRRNSNHSIAQHLYGSGAAGGGRESVDYFYYDDDLEGDLGYAAAEGMEGNQRKVIVERLEPVKQKNPVFTWC